MVSFGALIQLIFIPSARNESMADRERFIDNGDSTITDAEKKLMWTKTDSMIELKKWVNYQDQFV